MAVAQSNQSQWYAVKPILPSSRNSIAWGGLALEPSTPQVLGTCVPVAAGLIEGVNFNHRDAGRVIRATNDRGIRGVIKARWR